MLTIFSNIIQPDAHRRFQAWRGVALAQRRISELWQDKRTPGFHLARRKPFPIAKT